MTYDLADLPSTFLTPLELQVLLDMVKQHQPKVIVEYGVQRGRNPAAILRNFDFVERYVGVDVTPGHVTAMSCQRGEVPAVAGELALHDARYEGITRPFGSHELTATDLPNADFFIVDGDHSAVGVCNDRALSYECANPGAVIMYHDDNGRPEVQVTETLDMFRRRFGATIDHVDGTWWAVEVVK